MYSKGEHISAKTLDLQKSEKKTRATGSINQKHIRASGRRNFQQLVLIHANFAFQVWVCRGIMVFKLKDT